MKTLSEALFSRRNIRSDYSDHYEFSMPSYTIALDIVYFFNEDTVKLHCYFLSPEQRKKEIVEVLLTKDDFISLVKKELRCYKSINSNSTIRLHYGIFGFTYKFSGNNSISFYTEKVKGFDSRIYKFLENI